MLKFCVLEVRVSPQEQRGNRGSTTPAATALGAAPRATRRAAILRANSLQCTSLINPQSCVDPSFWSELASRKLDEYKLSEAPVEITGRRSVVAQITVSM